MGHFANIDIAIQEQATGRGREQVQVGAIGVCLADSGQPVRLYIVDTVYACGSLDVFALDDQDAPPRQVESQEFWALT